MSSRTHNRQPAIWAIPDALSAHRCAALIQESRALDWGMSGLGTQGGPIVEIAATPPEPDHECVTQLRDPRLALQLYYRVADYLPRQLGDWDLLCIRPQMELVRYRAGRRSRLHRDPVRFGTQAERSVLTLLVYLNDDFDGGETEFPGLERAVPARAGQALIFEQELEHRGTLVTRGQKMVLRASVYYVPGHMRARPSAG